MAVLVNLPTLQKFQAKRTHGLKRHWKLRCKYWENMQKIDANIILRYLMNDNPQLSPKAKEIIEHNIVEVPVEVLCEVVYVLKGHYKIDRQDFSSKLIQFFELTQCSLTNRDAILEGLDYFGKYKLDFVDCLLAGYAKIEKDEIYTFDDNLENLIKHIK